MKTTILLNKAGLCEGCTMSDITIHQLCGLEYVKCEHEDACNRAYDLGLHDGLANSQKHIDEVTE